MAMRGHENSLHIRLLGDLRVERGGQAVLLPASKRTRALLGYLVAVGGAQTRVHLCDLLWDGPDDPRAALRWSLTKLRPVVNDGSVSRLEADRDRVQFVEHGARVDVRRILGLLGDGVGQATLAALEEAAAFLQGEFLDGLDLPLCYRFHHWCMAERERMGKLRRQVLGRLIAALKHDPERGLPYAHQLVAADPLSESAHALLVGLLVEVGRAKEADAHYTYARDLLQRELAAPLSGDLKRPSRATRISGVGQPVLIEPGESGGGSRDERSVAASTPLVGREIELRHIEAAIASLAAPAERGMLMFLGEPGIGKTRFLQWAMECGERAGARIISARCFEAEMVRPYGMWLDALRRVPPDLIPKDSHRELAVLLPSPDFSAAGDGSRTRLFSAVARLLDRLGRERPLIAAFDDLQWIDEGSASLLHFLVRTLRPSSILFAASARQEEVDDNPWAKRLISSLERDRLMDKLVMTPLRLEEAAALLGAGTTEVEAAAIHRESGGNPLFLLELARAKHWGSDTIGRNLETLIDERIERLDDATREILVYAAVMGREFRPDVLGAALDISEAQLVERIERLERRGLLRSTLEGHFDFVHDLVRQTTYRGLSQPRRRMIHRRIAAALSAAAQLDNCLHGDLVHHAGLAEDYALAARACVAAADRCLRMFANSEADAVAERGLAFVGRMSSGPERTRLQIALFNAKVRGGFHALAATEPGTSRLTELLEEIQRAADEAEIMGLSQEAALAYHLMSWLTWRSNDSETARTAILDAERTSRTADDATRCLYLAHTGRCLLDVEADIERARGFVESAVSLAAKLNLHVVEIAWGQGLLARWDGDLECARAHANRALALARMREDRWPEIECLLWLAKIDLELGRHEDVIVHCDEVMRIAALIGGTHAPVAKALQFLAEVRKSPRGAGREIDKILIALRDFDDKANLAYFLNECATLELEHGGGDRARAYAREALAAASAVRRSTEVAVANAILARLAHAVGDSDGIARHVACLTSLGEPQHLSARARAHLELALACSTRTFQR